MPWPFPDEIIDLSGYFWEIFVTVVALLFIGLGLFALVKGKIWGLILIIIGGVIAAYHFAVVL